MATEKRLRISFDAEEEAIRRAVYIAAAMRGESHNKLLNDLIREHLGDALKLARQAIQDDDPAPPPRKKRGE